MIELLDVAKHYGAVHAVRGISLAIAAGEFVSIMGPSGSGKSTLMHLIGALDVPTSGSIRFGGENIQSMSDDARSHFRRQRIGFVFQAFNLMPTMTAAENVALPLLLGGTSRTQAMKQAMDSLETVGLAARSTHFPNQLSGGEMQRVAVARAVVTEPDALLCDEPTGNLDSATSAEILTLLAALPDAKRAVIMVTHDAGAAAYGTRIVRLRDGLLESDQAVDLKSRERE